MNFRLKFFLGFIGFLLFWFLIFYPIVLPWMNAINMYPLLAVIIYETLLFFTLWIISLMVLGEDHTKHSFKLSFALFAAYHILSSIEPPFALAPSGTYVMSDSAIISWDYGIGYTLQQIFGITGPLLYYVVNLGVTIGLLIITIFIVKPNWLGKIARQVLKD